MLRRAERKADGGGSTVEYAAVLLAVAVVAGAVIVVVPGQVSELTRRAICSIRELIGQNCELSDPEDGSGNEYADYDYSPSYCVKEGSSEQYGFSVDIGFLSLGQEYKYAREDLSDGRVIITFVPTTEVGATKALGWDFGESEAASTGANVETSLKAKFAPGSTFIFDSEEEFEKFEGEMTRAITEEQQRRMSPEAELGSAIAEVTGLYDPPELIDPTVRTNTVGIEAAIGGGVGTWVGETPQEGSGKFSLNIGAQGSVTVGANMNVATWHDDPDNQRTSRTYTFTGSGNLGATYLAGHAEGELSWNGGTRIMRNEDGSLANVRYTTTAEGAFAYGADRGIGKGKKNQMENGGEGRMGERNTTSVTQMVQIDFDTPEERRIGERMLRERGILPPENVVDSMRGPLMDEQTGGDINAEPGPEAPEWERLFYEKGRVWQYSSDKEIDEVDLAAKISLGMQFGVNVGWALEESATTDAQILDAPRNGNRRFVDYPDCVADTP